MDGERTLITEQWNNLEQIQLSEIVNTLKHSKKRLN